MPTRSAERSGLPRPIVENPVLQQWVDAVSDVAARNPNNTQNSLIDALRELGLIDRNGNLLNRWRQPLGTGTAGGEPIQAITGETREVFGPLDVPTLAVAPKPVGFEAHGGIGVVGMWWDNPWNHYENHAVTRVYRHTADEFNNAVEVGTAAHVAFVDETPADNEDATLWYWIRWETTGGALGPPSDGIEVEVVADPAIAIAALSAEILMSPFAQELMQPLEFDEITGAYLRSVGDAQSVVSNIVGGVHRRLAESVAAALDRQRGEEILALRGEIQIVSPLGPTPNTFRGVDRDVAEAARDAQGNADPTWLASYDDFPDRQVQLDWTPRE